MENYREMDSKLTRDQYQALSDWETKYGRTWKSKLRNAWITGNYDAFTGSNYLQQMRNSYGPSWLVGFRFGTPLDCMKTAERIAAPYLLMDNTDDSAHGTFETLDEARGAAIFDRLKLYTIYNSGRIVETRTND